MTAHKYLDSVKKLGSFLKSVPEDKPIQGVNQRHVETVLHRVKAYMAGLRKKINAV